MIPKRIRLAKDIPNGVKVRYLKGSQIYYLNRREDGQILLTPVERPNTRHPVHSHKKLIVLTRFPDNRPKEDTPVSVQNPEYKTFGQDLEKAVTYAALEARRTGYKMSVMLLGKTPKTAKICVTTSAEATDIHRQLSTTALNLLDPTKRVLRILFDVHPPTMRGEVRRDSNTTRTTPVKGLMEWAS